VNRTFLPALLLLAACGGGEPEIAVSDAWVRETRSGDTAAYMTIANRGSAPDRLVAVSVPSPASASLHETRYEGGIARMRPLPNGIDVRAGESVQLRPAGTHVMISGLPAALEPGDRLELSLRFERSGERRVAAEARPAMIGP
jgi:copper(I)-binding protein